MVLIPSVTYKSVGKEKSKITVICVHTDVNKNNLGYNGIEYAGDKPKSGWLVRQYSTSRTLFLLFVQQTCQNIARISSISLVH